MKKIVGCIWLISAITTSFIFAQKEIDKTEEIVSISDKVVEKILDDPCPVGPATNPSPPNGAINIFPYIPLNLTWENGENTTNIEVFFGLAGNMVNIYSGSPIDSIPIYFQLEYFKNYQWKVLCKNDTCSSFTETWHFTTMEDPTMPVDTVYPTSIQYFTGSTNGTIKTDGEVRAYDSEDGWMMFDLSHIPTPLIITSVKFAGYVNMTNWPYWSITPLIGLNPITASANDLKIVIEENSGPQQSYLYQMENSSFTTGWKSYDLSGNINNDLLNGFANGWFAFGIDSRDNSPNYFINWDGYTQPNVPYLIFTGHSIPVELTSLTSSVNENDVALNWTTATETNNSGFEIERCEKQGARGESWINIGYVFGKGTTTEPQSYSFIDEKLEAGKYQYRLKQIDFDGTFEYSNTIEVEINSPAKFSLEQNYPNPFNPLTNIKFSIPSVETHRDASLLTTLRVYDVLGKEVATLVNEEKPAGIYEVDFDARNLASGIYYYQLRAVDPSTSSGQSFVETKKMILLK